MKAKPEGTRPVSELAPYVGNARQHSDAQIDQLVASMREFGWTIPCLIDEAGGMIAGHGRVLAAERIYAAGGQIRGLDGNWLPDGHAPVLVARNWPDSRKRAYVIADNQIALNASWDEAVLKAEINALSAEDFDLDMLGFDDIALGEILGDPPAVDDGDATLARSSGLTDPDEAPPEPTKPTSALGDIWLLGNHRLMCGDATVEAHIAQLMQGALPDAILTDPPYCSGGFQESGKSVGSIGSAKVKKGGQFAGGIANDRLSTRGYLALMKGVLSLARAPILYAFTDWRMWINLYDVAESSGYGVRNMVVWDKGTPGMGMGWRTQHELVLFGAKTSVKFDNHKAQGNVIASKRTGNPLHPTQKPVDLLRSILAVTDMAAMIYDPFTGSGSTLIACEEEGRLFLGVELSPGFVDVTVRRWEEFTGRVATLESTGQTFREVSDERTKKTPA